MERKSLLTDDGNHLLLFMGVGVQIDKRLPKYSTIVSEESERGRSSSNFNITLNEDFTIETFNDEDLQQITDIELDNGAKELNIILNGKLKENIQRARLNSRTNTFRTEYLGDTRLNNSDEQEKKGIFNKVKRFFLRGEDKGKEQVVETVDILQFFHDVKLTVEAQPKYVNRVKDFANLVKKADKSGQTALMEKLTKELIIQKYESVLYAFGYSQYITEEQLVNFIKKTEKGLALDYLYQYVRIIPDEVLKVKEELDKLEVFDNYVILHYDPDMTGVEQTEEEKIEEVKKRQDPILFGVIADSKKLYYIADWIDEYCDLTWEQIAETLGKEEVEKSQLTEKVKL